ncbi:interleukin-17 receptor A [Mixophyes fleayi]|uniref:interleukin-17 receptor A n=1 Tax=Mixophyes fleayi TaxID=3061075 RepID=UPI003F4E4334
MTPGPRGPSAPHRALYLTLLLAAAQGLRVIPQPEPSCSQPGIQCTLVHSNCFDISWLHPFDWTPTAPDHVEVTVGTGLDETGRRVPVLQINWTVSRDASIKTLQGAEISILEAGTSTTRCVQFHFGNEFPGQLNENGQQWQFSYNKFQVEPGEYHVTIQHLPKQEDANSKHQSVNVPNCSDPNMIHTDTCCQMGYCWNPNISLEVGTDNLVVMFTPEKESHEYGVQVLNREDTKLYEKIKLQSGTLSERVQVTFPSPVTYNPCWYTIVVWPYHPSCQNDCVRMTYKPICSLVTAPTPPALETPGRLYLWAISVFVTFLFFAAVITMLYFYKECIYPGGKTLGIPEPPAPPPPLAKRKVWLVYSADHKHYVNVIIRLADLLSAWGLDVVLDRFHVQDIGKSGAVPWLGRQKEEIEKVNGTILILCSRGAQEKWKAMQNLQEPRVTLREDITHQFGDLFTPSLALILPDFQKAKPYDRYVVAYFGKLFNLGHILSPLDICPKFALTENLQDLFFRIQRQERHQPNLQFSVVQEENPAYQPLVRAIERCQKWQDNCLDWFEKECSPIRVEEADSTEEEEEVVDSNLTRKAHPLVRCPETSVCMVNPIIKKPESVMVIDPMLVVGPPSTRVEPLLYEANSTLAIQQPLLKAEDSTEAFVLEPLLVGEEISLPELNKPSLDFSIPSDQGFRSMDHVSEAQKRFFYHSFLEDKRVTPDMDLIVAQPDDLYESPERTSLVDPCAADINLPIVPADKLPQQSADQGYNSWNPNEGDLQAIKDESVRLLLLNGGLADFQ